CKLHSFADDSTLHTSSCLVKPLSSQDMNEIRIQQCNKVNSDLKFNASKTQACSFSRKMNSTVPDITMANETISITSFITMLGVTIGDNLSWHDHV
ncbi:hypothetical protein HHI36_011838, partial [Cryptolaemus montrouzieri]